MYLTRSWAIFSSSSSRPQQLVRKKREKRTLYVRVCVPGGPFSQLWVSTCPNTRSVGWLVVRYCIKRPGIPRSTVRDFSSFRDKKEKKKNENAANSRRAFNLTGVIFFISNPTKRKKKSFLLCPPIIFRKFFFSFPRWEEMNLYRKKKFSPEGKKEGQIIKWLIGYKLWVYGGNGGDPMWQSPPKEEEEETFKNLMAFWGTKKNWLPHDHQGVVWGSFIIFCFFHGKKKSPASY